MTASAHAAWAVAVDSPLAQLLSYRADGPLHAGALVRVPLGPRRVTGVVVGPAAASDGPATLRAVAGVFAGIPPLAPAWMQLAQFAASYYQRPLGEIVAASLPPPLLDNEPGYLERVLDRLVEPAYVATAAGRRAITGGVP
ncbi:MAG: primosomal protein N', partial [Betaproteobacteria bacterium]|nr:primosomal protein N' [Betaproteobacteria bacterium]